MNEFVFGNVRRHLRRLTVLAGVCLLIIGWSGSSLAQTPGPQVTAGQSFKVQFDGVTFADGYRAYVDGLKVGADLPSPATLTGIQLTIPSVGVGAHTVQISAFNTTGEGAKSAPLSFAAVAPLPGIPTNLTIVANVAINSDGTVTLKLARVTIP